LVDLHCQRVVRRKIQNAVENGHGLRWKARYPDVQRIDKGTFAMGDGAVCIASASGGAGFLRRGDQLAARQQKQEQALGRMGQREFGLSLKRGGQMGRRCGAMGKKRKLSCVPRSHRRL